MPSTTSPEVTVSDTVALVRHWLKSADRESADPAAAQLADLLRDPAGLPFTVGFIDGVIRPEDPTIAAANLRRLAADVPGFLPWHLRSALKLGAFGSRFAPALVIPVVQRALRHLVSHLVVDAREARLGRAIGKIRTPGVRLNLNLLGEAVLGSAEADRRLSGTMALLDRDDVDYVSIKVSATVPPHQPWSFDAAVEDIIDALLPLYRRAAAASPAKFINLDMEEYRDLDLTTAVFTGILDLPEFTDLSAGIVLQAYLPDALGAMQHLQEWSEGRRARGGAPVKVRVVKGANLPMERVEADLHDWPIATWGTKAETDASYKSVLSWALTPERTQNVRIGVAGHNLFDLAWTWLLAGRREVRDALDVEMLLGMAPGQADAVRRDVGELLLYTPAVHPTEFDVAIAYLIRRLEEGASHENFMSAVFELTTHEDLFERERDRFERSLALMFTEPPLPRRRQDRRREVLEFPAEFSSTPDTDPALPGNREWARGIRTRIDRSALGADLVEATTVEDASGLEAELSGAVAAANDWGSLTGSERAAVLRAAAVELGRRRADLLEVMAAECGKTLDQGDPEVSEAIDFSRHYADLAEALDRVDGARFTPVRLTLVVPPWNFPVAIPAGSTLAALAAGSSVIVKPAPQARRCGALMVQALWDAGVPRDVLRLVNVGEDDLGRSLVSDPRVDRLILTGAYDTAALFRSFRRDLPILAETSGKNAIIVTPHADLDLAVKDIVASAFGHAGQKCSAASLVILVGSVGSSPRFRRQLVDAVESLPVGTPSDPRAKMGPVIEPATGKLLDGLTRLEPGESWLVEPRQLDDEGRLWSPGVRDGVRPRSPFHLTEYFGPVLGIMTAATLDEAIALQNDVDYGLTAGLHSLDEDEQARWIDRVEAGNLYVNRGITGAIVRRQPFGGWKKSAVGPGAKAGGPNYLLALGDWAPVHAHATAAPTDRVARFVDQARAALGLTADEAEFLQRSVASDAAAVAEEFGRVRDVTGLWSERNEFRYRATPCLIDVTEHARPADVARIVAAALALPDAEYAVSGGSAAVRRLLELTGIPRTDGIEGWHRIRTVGGSAARIREATDGRPDIAVWDQPVTEAGRLELLPFLHEQAISVTAHRFGTPLR